MNKTANGYDKDFEIYDTKWEDKRRIVRRYLCTKKEGLKQ